VDESDRTTVRLNGHQYVLSSRMRDTWARGGWNALGADDKARIRLMLDLVNDPASLIEAMAAVEHGRVPDIAELEWMYTPMAPGGCGVGGKCSDEAWRALKDFMACTGSAGATVVTALAGRFEQSFFGGLVVFSSCADWVESNDVFTSCCGRHIGGGGDGDDPDGDDPDDGEACDHCVPPDLEGPNPPCCYRGGGNP